MERVESGSGGTVFDLAAQLGIGDLERFLRAWIANAAMMSGSAGPRGRAAKLKYTVEEAAEMLGVSARWLAGECRAGRVEHVHLARHRFFSHDQIVRLLQKHAVEPFDERPVDPDLVRVMRRIQRDRSSADRNGSSTGS